MFNFKAVDADIPIEVGINQFKVEKIEKDTVKSEGENFGAQMMVAHLMLRDKKGNTKRVKQYFVMKDEYMHKLAFFCHAIGAYEKYKTGQLAPSDLVGKVGRCETERTDKEIDGKEVKVVEIVKFIKKENKETA
jgi:hypothetical protein